MKYKNSKKQAKANSDIELTAKEIEDANQIIRLMRKPNTLLILYERDCFEPELLQHGQVVHWGPPLGKEEESAIFELHDIRSEDQNLSISNPNVEIER